MFVFEFFLNQYILDFPLGPRAVLQMVQQAHGRGTGPGP